MSSSSEEVPITSRISERPGFDLGKLKDVKPRDIGLRFVAGAVTSIVAGLLSTLISARVGGFLLAFPAILGASLTLIQEQEDSAEAREDARGAAVGGGALALFAAIAALTLAHVGSLLALALATAGWCLGAACGYLIAWFR
jgi:hypothetical protein